MTPDQDAHARHQALLRLSDGLLRSAGRRAVRGNVLELHHPDAPLLDPSVLDNVCGAFGVSISLSQDEHTDNGQRLCCRSDQLPFQDGAFNMVVLHHVVGQGDEPELAEAVRVLARDGVLILIGLNRVGWRYLSQSDLRRLPGLAPLKVRSRLYDMEMDLKGFAGAGLGGRPGPEFMNEGLLGLLVPLADLLLLQAQHRAGAGVMPLRFRKPRSAVVQSAPMRG